MAKDYKELKIWQKGIEIVNKTYDLTDGFPKSELYTLVSQMRRSALSIPSNIAEGFVRRHPKEHKQFLYVALGSAAELETQIIVATHRKYINEEDSKKLTGEINIENKMIMSLIQKIN